MATFMRAAGSCRSLLMMESIPRCVLRLTKCMTHWPKPGRRWAASWQVGAVRSGAVGWRNRWGWHSQDVLEWIQRRRAGSHRAEGLLHGVKLYQSLTLLRLYSHAWLPACCRWASTLHPSLHACASYIAHISYGHTCCIEVCVCKLGKCTQIAARFDPTKRYWLREAEVFL
jgi:hypothetical protein